MRRWQHRVRSDHAAGIPSPWGGAAWIRTLSRDEAVSLSLDIEAANPDALAAVIDIMDQESGFTGNAPTVDAMIRCIQVAQMAADLRVLELDGIMTLTRGGTNVYVRQEAERLELQINFPAGMAAEMMAMSPEDSLAAMRAACAKDAS